MYISPQHGELAFVPYGFVLVVKSEWRNLVAERPLDVGKPRVRPPRCDTRVSPEDKRRFMTQRAAEVAQRRALFDAAIATPTP